MEELYVPDLLYDFYENDGDEINDDIEKRFDSTAEDALLQSLDPFGHVDVNALKQRTGVPLEEILDVLGGNVMFQDPAVFSGDQAVYDETQGWLLHTYYAGQ